MLNEYIPTGLWTVHVIVQTDEGDGFYLVWQMRVDSDEHFWRSSVNGDQVSLIKH